MQTLLYLIRRSYAYIWTLILSSEPVSEALLPTYNQLNTLRKCLEEVKKSGGVSSMRELYPYAMKVGPRSPKPFGSWHCSNTDLGRPPLSTICALTASSTLATTSPRDKEASARFSTNVTTYSKTLKLLALKTPATMKTLMETTILKSRSLLVTPREISKQLPPAKPEARKNKSAQLLKLPSRRRFLACQTTLVLAMSMKKLGECLSLDMENISTGVGRWLRVISKGVVC